MTTNIGFTQRPVATSNPTSLLPKRRRNKRIYKLAAILGCLLLLILVGKKLFSPKSQPVVAQTLGQTTKQTDINYSFSIPIKTKTGDASDNTLDFNILTAELTDEIILKGQKATAVNGRTFLILNIKLSNSSQTAVKLDTRNYVRLSVNGSTDRLAPNVHNDPVEVQPISDQPTRLGFSINKADQNPILYVGEISGDKHEIPLTFN